MSEKKKCPYCAEEILVDAIKCRYCKEFLENNKKTTTFIDEYFEKGLLELDAKNYTSALIYFRESLLYHPDNENVHYQLGFSYLKNNDISNALTHLKNAIQINPDLDDAYLNIGESYTVLFYNKIAEQYYIKAAQLDNSQAISLCEDLSIEYYCQTPKLELPHSLWTSRRVHATEILKFRKILEENPIDLDTCFKMGAAYTKLGDDVNSKECFKKIILIDPYYANKQYKLGFDETNKMVFEQMIENVKVAFGIERTDELISDDYTIKGLSNLSRKDYKSAVKCFEKALYLKPNHVEASYWLGISYKNINDYESAIIYFENAIETAPINHKERLGNIYAQLGLSYLYLDKEELGISYIKLAAELGNEIAINTCEKFSL